jgi:hypothetical protein
VPPELIVAIATAGAKALVAAMGTDTWSSVRSKAAKLLGHRTNKLAVLDEASSQVARARNAGQDERLGAINGIVRTILEDMMTEDASTIEMLRALCAELGTSVEVVSVQGSQTAHAQDEAQQAVQFYGTQKNEFTRGNDK